MTPNGNKPKQTQDIMLELNGVYLTTYGETFTNALITHCKDEEVTRKKTKTEMKRERRTILRKCRDTVSKQMAETAALSVLAEDDSMAKYQRKRMLQSFERPPQPKRSRSHTATTLDFDRDAVLQYISNHPPTMKINWSALARKHVVDKTNGGQTLNLLARKEWILLSLSAGPSNLSLESVLRRGNCQVRVQLPLPSPQGPLYYD